MRCMVENCQYENEDKKAFATHLQMAHKMKSLEYTIKYINGNKIPVCPICCEKTRYVSFTFKKYCKEHSNYAESEAGVVGGKIKKTWNKGKTKETDERIKKLSEGAMGERNHFFGKTHSEETKKRYRVIQRMSEQEYNKRIQDKEKYFYCLTSYKQYSHRQRQYLELECKACGNRISKTLYALERSCVCPHCQPSSQQENDIGDFIESLSEFEVLKNKKNIISPLEIDVFVPSKNLGIEYNGLYWHSEMQKENNYHFNKSKMAREKNIKLIHIFSDEWMYKKEIVQSMIRYSLGVTINRIFARNCTVEIISNREGYKFFDRTHISGKTACNTTIALKHNNKIVSCLTLKIPVQKKKYEGCVEIMRFANELDTIVVGGFSRMLKYAKKWAKENNFKSILTYADLRFGNGNVYKTSGFEFLGTTGLNYWYTDGDRRYPRQKFQARLDEGKTEKMVAQENAVYRIYGCGHHIYKLDL